MNKETFAEFCKRLGVTKDQGVEILREQEIENEIERMMMIREKATA